MFQSCGPYVQIRITISRSGKGGGCSLAGPGSGKTTVSRMVAQLHRVARISAQRNVLPESLGTKLSRVVEGIDKLAGELEIGPRTATPVRVSLPKLATWMSSQGGGGRPSDQLWRFLADRMRTDCATQNIHVDLSGDETRALFAASGSLFWIFDGLDEVPRTAGRAEVIAVVRSAISDCDASQSSLLVTTRPQGYEGEFHKLDAMVVGDLEEDAARSYGERLLRAWCPDWDAEAQERLEVLLREMGKPEVQALVQTPLHATMATLLVASSGELPRSRWLLFDHYFKTIFTRELSKQGRRDIRREDERLLRDLHARAGLSLHVRSQEQFGAQPALRRRELRELLSTLFRERGFGDEELREETERILRFTSDRLVLLLQVREGRYAFGIRSIQEFFAAQALLSGSADQVAERVRAIVLNPHWANVLGLMVSERAMSGSRPEDQEGVLDMCVGTCRSLNSGELGGEAAKRCVLGSRLALVMLQEIERYGEPWLVDPLWAVALEAGDAPIQPTMMDLGSGGIWNDVVAQLASADSTVDHRKTIARIGNLSPNVLGAALDQSPLPDHDTRLELHKALLRTLRSSVDPAFTSSEAWATHSLPSPPPSTQPPALPPTCLVRLNELSGVRVFQQTPEQDAPFPTPTPGEGQWLMFVGENGMGKTTLLRAIALALSSPIVAAKLLDERLPFARNGSQGRIAIQLASGTFSINVGKTPGERTESVHEEDSSGERPWIVGYGVRRGNARGEKDREPDPGPVGELHTLFDRPASLINAVEWIKELDRQALRQAKQMPQRDPDAQPTGRAAVLRSVERALSGLLRITKLEPDEDHVFVVHPEFGRVRLDALSDGYLTTAGWVIDMIARWVDRQRELDEPVGPDLLREMTGVVLIDEIDLHLHPVWQLSIVSDLRRLFPRMSFIATTHNPLTLQGLRPGETFIMRKGEQGHIELAQRDVFPGHDVDRVLLEQFGVEHTFDKQTRDLLAEHRKMLAQGASLEDPQRIELEKRLSARLGGTGDTIVSERGASPGFGPEERHLLAPFLKK